MFLKVLKNYFIKRKLKARLLKMKAGASMDAVKSIGILVDESNFEHVGELQVRFRKLFPDTIVRVLAYREKVKPAQAYDYPVFSMKAITTAGDIVDKEVRSFISAGYDMLISYYDVEKPVLMLITDCTVSPFKVGFSAIDKRLNHFTISTGADQHEIFISELARYLKILKKI